MFVSDANSDHMVIVVVCLPRHMEGMVRLPIFRYFTELPVPPQAAGVIGTFFRAFYYISFWELRSHFWTLMMPYYFFNVSFFVYISTIFCKYTLHVCYVFNVILLMTDGLNSV